MADASGRGQQHRVHPVLEDHGGHLGGVFLGQVIHIIARDMAHESEVAGRQATDYPGGNRAGEAPCQRRKAG